MKFKGANAEEDWKLGRKNNPDGYGKAIFDYAEAWANLMEEKMAAGAALADMWKAASHEADAEGITGFMYGAAISILSGAWEHGEDLRRLHNLDTQIGHEGELANEKGGTLNPAILLIGGDPEKGQA
jgi:hypothetical protein